MLSSRAPTQSGGIVRSGDEDNLPVDFTERLEVRIEGPLRGPHHQHTILWLNELQYLEEVFLQPLGLHLERERETKEEERQKDKGNERLQIPMSLI